MCDLYKGVEVSVFYSKDIRPSRGRILIKASPSEKSGIFVVPDNAKDKPFVGEVLAVGQGSISDDGNERSMEYSAGQSVLFAKWSGTQIECQDCECLIVKDSDVLGVIDGGING